MFWCVSAGLKMDRVGLDFTQFSVGLATRVLRGNVVRTFSRSPLSQQALLALSLSRLSWLGGPGTVPPRSSWLCQGYRIRYRGAPDGFSRQSLTSYQPV